MVNPGCVVRPGMLVGPKTVVNSVQRYDEDCILVQGNLPKRCELVDGHWIAPGSNVTPWMPAWWPPREGDWREKVDEAAEAEMGTHMHKPSSRMQRSSRGSSARSKGRTIAAAALVATIMTVFGASLWLLSSTFGQPKALAAAIGLHPQRHRHRLPTHRPLGPHWPKNIGPTDNVEHNTSANSAGAAVSPTQADAEARAAAAAAAEASARRESAAATAQQAEEDRKRQNSGSAAGGGAADLDARLGQLLGPSLDDAGTEAADAALEEAKAQREEATAAAAAAEVSAAAAAAAAAATHAAAAAAAANDIAASTSVGYAGEEDAAGLGEELERTVGAASSANQTSSVTAQPVVLLGPSSTSSMRSGSVDSHPVASSASVSAQETTPVQGTAADKAGGRELAAAALETGPPHANTKYAERTSPASVHHGSSKLAGSPARKSSGLHPMFGALVAGVVPRAASEPLSPDQGRVRHMRHAFLESDRTRQSATMGPSSSGAHARVGAQPYNASVVKEPHEATVGTQPHDATFGTQSHPTGRPQKASAVDIAVDIDNGPPCDAYDKYNSRCYRSFADVVIACSIFSFLALVLTSGELYRFARRKLSKSTGHEEKSVQASSSSGYAEHRLPILDHAKLMGVLGVIYLHFAMPSMTGMLTAPKSAYAYAFPSAGTFWGFPASSTRPSRELFMLPPWLDIFLLAFPRNLMAILAFVSGFSSKAELTVRRYEGVILLILARTLYGGLVSKAESHYGFETSNFSDPEFYGGHLWYLYALITWRLAVQVLRPLYPAIGLVSALCISVFADRIFTGAEQSTWAVDSWALKKSSGLFFAFVAGFYCPKEWIMKLRHPGSRAGAFLLQCTLYFIYSQGSFVEWYFSNVSDLTELRHQNALLMAAYAPDDIWQTRALAVLVTTVQAFAMACWMPHTEEWHTRYGAASLYPYMLHWHVLLFVLPHWDQAMLDLLPDTHARWAVTYLFVLPGLILLPLSGVLWRLLWWVLLEPTWARIAFDGRLGKLRDAYQERGFHHACQLAVDEFTPEGIKLAVPWVFGLWFTVVLAVWVTMLMLFDASACLQCHVDSCKEIVRAYVVVIGNAPEAFHNKANEVTWKIDPVAAAYDHGRGFTTRNGDGLFLPGGGAFATFVTVLLFLGLAFELGVRVMPMLHSAQVPQRERV